MTVPDTTYQQIGNYHEFYRPAEAGDREPSMWLEVHCQPYGLALYTSDQDGNLLRLNLNDARILRDVLTEHIARQDRRPA